MAEYADRKGRWGWILLDWANQPFHTLIITFIFGPYFLASVIGDEVAGQSAWAWMNGVAGMMVALTAPFLGAIADQSGPRKPWIFGFGVIFVVGCFGLWWAVPGAENLWPIYIAFILAFMGAEYILVFANAMLPDLAPREDIGRLSGTAWGFGYLGGLVVLIVMLLFLWPTNGETTLIGLTPLFGLDPALGESERITGPISAIWFLVFAIPLFRWTPDVTRKIKKSSAVQAGIQEVKKSWHIVKGDAAVGNFYLASLFYRDALVVVYSFGSLYAVGVLEWGTTMLGVFGILAAITGALGAWLGGIADSKYGPTPVVSGSILTLLLVTAIVLGMTRESFFGIGIGVDSALPDIVFMICGGLIGAAGGSMQASSRTLTVHITSGKLTSTEAFGIYALAGKATAFIGPITVAIATTATGSQRLGLLPVVLIFAAGLYFLHRATRAHSAE